MLDCSTSAYLEQCVSSSTSAHSEQYISSSTLAHSEQCVSSLCNMIGASIRMVPWHPSWVASVHNISLDFVCSDFRSSKASRTTLVSSWNGAASLIGVGRGMRSNWSRFGVRETNAMSLSAIAMRWVPGRPLAPSAVGGAVMRRVLVAPVLSDMDPVRHLFLRTSPRLGQSSGQGHVNRGHKTR